ncbi:hypothetical protein Ocin01_08494 [Orchesella cincta]|uniref:Protein sleepless n=1 Tax=Orchesella cincta TaxID=48709 RepID=A0A1D2MYQ4_ORCCI|nr:hypothetical protein Ocin01_08494 [Orchesella cincta]
MQRFRRVLITWMVILVLMSSLEIQLTEGIKCYDCGNCTGMGGEEFDCGSDDRCLETMVVFTKSRKIIHTQTCSSEKKQKESVEKNYTCDSFRQFEHWENTFVKECFCSTDLCNTKLLTTECKSNDGPMIGGYFYSTIASFTTTFFLLKGLLR